MRIAQLNNQNFFVMIRPDVFRFSPKTEMYPGTWTILHEGQPVQVPMNLIDIQYEILATHWVRKAATEEDEDQLVVFGEPVRFDAGVQSIPFQLHLLIESYRDDPTPEKLEMINGAVSQFPFQASLEGFVLNVTSIQ
jgi:hypothetical protein